MKSILLLLALFAIQSDAALADPFKVRCAGLGSDQWAGTITLDESGGPAFGIKVLESSIMRWDCACDVRVSVEALVTTGYIFREEMLDTHPRCVNSGPRAFYLSSLETGLQVGYLAYDGTLSANVIQQDAKLVSGKGRYFHCAVIR